MREHRRKSKTQLESRGGINTMGTSASHNGPKSGVPFDPPWLDDIDGPINSNDPPADPSQQVPSLLPLAPPARFRNARLKMGDYVRSGNRESLQKSLGHYSRTGMGGAQNVANRMRHSASTASKLYNSFASLRQGNEPTLSILIDSYKANHTDVYDMIDRIAVHISNDRGSLDEVSAKDSVFSALSDMLEKHPDIDLTALSDDDIWSLVSSFLSYEAFSRIQLDIGQGFETNDVPLDERVTRLMDMREYLESEIASQIGMVRTEAISKMPSDLQRIIIKAIERTFKVFEVMV